MGDHTHCLKNDCLVSLAGNKFTVYCLAALISMFIPVITCVIARDVHCDGDESNLKGSMSLVTAWTDLVF